MKGAKRDLRGRQRKAGLAESGLFGPKPVTCVVAGRISRITKGGRAIVHRGYVEANGA